MLEEQLQIITGLWEMPVGQRFSFKGRHYSIKDSPALPKPVQQPRPPVIMGGWGSRRTPGLAAQFADEFNVPFPPLDAFATQITHMREACERAGRDPASLVLSTALVVCCATGKADFERRVAAIGRQPDELRKNGAAGTPSEVIETLQQFAAAGAQRIYLQILDLDDLDHLRLIGTEVLPHV
jgi:alkanesulfonate monooxygenase SsuD/methylene tetrahydromethanopterin reductase-like flavin-dependent oxidoreductase (luciferase family)